MSLFFTSPLPSSFTSAIHPPLPPLLPSYFLSQSLPPSLPKPCFLLFRNSHFCIHWLCCPVTNSQIPSDIWERRVNRYSYFYSFTFLSIASRPCCFGLSCIGSTVHHGYNVWQRRWPGSKGRGVPLSPSVTQLSNLLPPNLTFWMSLHCWRPSFSTCGNLGVTL